MLPQDLRYTAQHEWLRESDGVVRVGITDFAQDALGDVVFVQLPAVGDTVTAGESCGEVESTKSVSDVYSPVTGEVVARNEALEQTPELVNSDPYGEGWMFEVRGGAQGGQELLDADAYAALTQQ
ncbi:glycine cleavage system H protein [Motilibacter peucedani]|uniref:Glycine cleavage system H protein n=1 Tax=Motilibacter peucedani TaxID=598650 RepID=A0A420XSP1_9ACTN|nr:glycine cleavage system protein GcvH [Motilibacter peucedani]RKS77886.1 glycine cleavage system H protein [Motilibacter peucedani]